MQVFRGQFKIKEKVLALGSESDGNFSFYDGKKVYFSDSFGDLLDEDNFKKFTVAVNDFIAKNDAPNVVITDLHPLFRTTKWGKELAENYDAKFIQIQHHHAHVFSAVGDYCLGGRTSREVGPPQQFLGIACDGTGYGLDEKIWGGEVFRISNFQFPISNKNQIKIERIGKLEDQTLIGGELAIKEPVRMLISILSKCMEKSEVYSFVKEYYDKNELELLWNQWQEGFNCLETSSAGRVLDAVSVLLGFSPNERPYKHAPINLLEKNSGKPYEIEPVISSLSSRVPGSETERSLENCEKRFFNSSFQEVAQNDNLLELQTTELFKYLIQNLDKDKRRLAATVQIYLAKGLWEIILCHSGLDPEFIQKGLDSRSGSGMTIPVFFAGGMANNKIMSKYLSSKGVIVSKEIPRGDAGLSVGQLFYYLLSFRTIH